MTSFRNIYLAQRGEFRLEPNPNPPGQVFRRRVLQPGDVIQVAMVQLIKQRRKTRRYTRRQRVPNSAFQCSPVQLRAMRPIHVNLVIKPTPIAYLTTPPPVATMPLQRGEVPERPNGLVSKTNLRLRRTLFPQRVTTIG